MSILRCCMYTKQTHSSNNDLQKSLTSDDELSKSIHGECLREESIEDEPVVIKEEPIVVRCSLSSLLEIFCCKAPDKKVRFKHEPHV